MESSEIKGMKGPVAETATETQGNGNLAIWNQVKDTPKEALRPIKSGRLAGFSDINPVWRFKKLTEVFGPAGQGWKIENVRWETESDPMVKCVGIQCMCDFYYRLPDGTWSEPIVGVGGSSMIASESSGPRYNDEGRKMSYTDAISVICKTLGMSEDVYMSGHGRTDSKYQDSTEGKSEDEKRKVTEIISRCMNTVNDFLGNKDAFKTILDGLRTQKKIPNKPSSQYSVEEAEILVKEASAVARSMKEGQR